MKVKIVYCKVCNYYPIAATLAVEIRKDFGLEVECVSGPAGVYDVFLDERLIFSKTKEGRFPKKGEVAEALKSAGAAK